MAIYVNHQNAKSFLSDVSEDKSFYMQDGEKLKNIYELRSRLEGMGQEEYNKYVSRVKSDFANWVGGVFKNKRLEEGLNKARTPKEARLYLDRNIKMLERNSKR